MGQKNKEQELTVASCYASHVTFVVWLNCHKNCAGHVLFFSSQMNKQVPSYTCSRCGAGI